MPRIPCRCNCFQINQSPNVHSLAAFGLNTRVRTREGARVTFSLWPSRERRPILCSPVAVAGCLSVRQAVIASATGGVWKKKGRRRCEETSPVLAAKAGQPRKRSGGVSERRRVSRASVRISFVSRETCVSANCVASCPQHSVLSLQRLMQQNRKELNCWKAVSLDPGTGSCLLKRERERESLFSVLDAANINSKVRSCSWVQDSSLTQRSR